MRKRWNVKKSTRERFVATEPKGKLRRFATALTRLDRDTRGSLAPCGARGRCN